VEAIRNDCGNVNGERPLADLLRKTLTAARGNLAIRERLRVIVSDPVRLESIVRELGPTHALVRELLQVGRHGQPDAERVV
jgi:hypothetical protein